MKNRVVYNNCFGGFELSDDAVYWLAENGSRKTRKFLNEEIPKHRRLGHPMWYAGYDWLETVPRHHKDLVAVVEALGGKASGKFSNLVIHELSGNQYRIEVYDGLETVHEPSTEEWITIKG